jgi:hypothetical protein
LPSECGEHIPLVGGELAVRHGYDLFSAVEVLASIAAPPNSWKCVALSL